MQKQVLGFKKSYCQKNTLQLFSKKSVRCLAIVHTKQILCGFAKSSIFWHFLP
jgi:hypothetical protein